MEKEEILRILKEYVSGKVRLNGLEDWVLAHIQGILCSGNQEAIALIDKVDALLIEIGAGVADEEELFSFISGVVSDAETVTVELRITGASNIKILSVTQSAGDGPIAPLPGSGLYLSFA